MLGAAAGAVAGLVGITPAAGYVSPASALVIGAGAGLLYFSPSKRSNSASCRRRPGCLRGARGRGHLGGPGNRVVRRAAVEPAGNDGLFFGNPGLFGKQLIAVGAAIALAGLGSFVLLKVVDVVVGLRVPEDEEVLGLDPSQHGELAYQL